MRKIFTILTAIVLLTSCTKDKNPILDFKIETTKSDVFQKATISFGSMGFLNKDEETGQNGGSILQQWQGVKFEQDLSNNQTTPIVKKEHWQLELTGIQPGFSITVTENDQEKIVMTGSSPKNIMYVETQLIENNKEYEITFKMDTDRAIQNVGGKYEFNWEFMTISIEEKE